MLKFFSLWDLVEQPLYSCRSRSRPHLRKYATLLLLLALAASLLCLKILNRGTLLPLRPKRTFVFPVFTEGLEAYYETVRRESSQLRSNYIHRSLKWKAGTNTWKVQGEVSEKGLMYIKLLIGDNQKVFFLELDFGGGTTWVNCKWKPLEVSGKWKPLEGLFKWPMTLGIGVAKGPNGFYKGKDKDSIWCQHRLCLEALKDSKTTYQCDDKISYCQFDHTYHDRRSIQGVMVRDNITLTDDAYGIIHEENIKALLIFGCVYKRVVEVDNRKPKTLNLVDGVMGLSPSHLSVPSQLMEKAIADNVIGLCLAEEQGYEAGYLVLGFPVAPLKRAMTWCPMHLPSERKDYQMKFNNIKYGDDTAMKGELLMKEHRIVFDSNSRLLYLEPPIYRAFAILVQREARRAGYVLQNVEEDRICWSHSQPIKRIKELMQGFRTVTLMFGERPARRMFLEPGNYLMSPAEGLICLSIVSETDLQEPVSILGSVLAIKGHLLVLDNVDNQIGWMKDKNCSSQELEQLVEKPPLRPARFPI